MQHLALRLLPAIFLGLVSSACTHVPLASTEDDASAKTFETRPGACGLYVFREGSRGGSTELELVLDGCPFGSTGGFSR